MIATSFPAHSVLGNQPRMVLPAAWRIILPTATKKQQQFRLNSGEFPQGCNFYGP